MGVSMTVAQITTKVQTEVQDTAGDYATTALINGFVNDAMAEWCERTRQRRERTTIDVTAEVETVDLSSVTPIVLEVEHVFLPKEEDGTDVYELPYRSIEWLNEHYPNWLTYDAGQPICYTREVDNAQTIRFFPKPETDYSAFALSGGQVSYDSLYGMEEQATGISDATYDSLYGMVTSASSKYGGCQIIYKAGGSAYANTSQTPWTVSKIPPEHHEALFNYCVARFLEADTEIKQVERAALYRAKWEAAIAAATTNATKDYQEQPRAPLPFYGY